mgnify:FL=1
MNLSTRGKEFHAMEQLNRDPMKLFFDNLEYLKGFEYVALVCHPGFVDADLLKLSSCSLERMRDLEFYLSTEMKDFILENGIELISFSDLTA